MTPGRKYEPDLDDWVDGIPDLHGRLTPPADPLHTEACRDRPAFAGTCECARRRCCDTQRAEAHDTECDNWTPGTPPKPSGSQHPDDPAHIWRADLRTALATIAITNPDQIAALHIYPTYVLVVRRPDPTTTTTRRIEIR